MAVRLLGSSLAIAIVAFLSALSAAQRTAAQDACTVPDAVPTLGAWGVLALAGVLVLFGIAMRRKSDPMPTGQDGVKLLWTLPALFLTVVLLSVSAPDSAAQDTRTSSCEVARAEVNSGWVECRDDPLQCWEPRTLFFVSIMYHGDPMLGTSYSVEASIDCNQALKVYCSGRTHCQGSRIANVSEDTAGRGLAGAWVENAGGEFTARFMTKAVGASPGGGVCAKRS